MIAQQVKNGLQDVGGHVLLVNKQDFMTMVSEDSAQNANQSNKSCSESAWSLPRSQLESLEVWVVKDGIYKEGVKPLLMSMPARL